MHSTTKITGLTYDNVRALRETHSDALASGNLVLGKTTAEWQVPVGAALAHLEGTMAMLPGRGHPRASLHAVVRKLEGLAQAERAAEQLLPAAEPEPRAGASCTCEWEDTGTGETGPMPSITERSEACPRHGRGADPEGWAEAEAHERGYVLSGVRQCLPAEAGISVEGNEALAMALYEVAEQLQHPDDAHGTDKAIAHVAQVLVVLYTGSAPEPVPCLGHLVPTPVHQPEPEHTPRQQAWARAATARPDDPAAGLFALLAEPNEAERAKGITTSPLHPRP